MNDDFLFKKCSSIIESVFHYDKVLNNLFVIEGCDGVGKTHISKKVVETLKSQGRKVQYIKEPGTTEVGESIRNILLNRDTLLDYATQFMLFTTARVSLLHYIESNSDTIFICDRFFDSTLVYQCLVPSFKESCDTQKEVDAKIRLMVSFLETGLWKHPKKTILLFRDKKAAWEAANKEINVFEKQGEEYYNTVYTCYYSILSKYRDCVYNEENKLENTVNLVLQAFNLI